MGTNSKLHASPQQEGIWFHSEKNGSSYWNFTQNKSFHGNLDVHNLQQALEGVMQLHSSLRTNFRLEDKILSQVIHNSFSIQDVFEFRDYNLIGFDRIKDTVAYHLQRAEKFEFDFEKDVLIRFTVLKFDSTFFFILTINHIITDSISMELFWKDLADHYNKITQGNGAQASAAVKQYYEYTECQLEFSDTPEFERLKQYWLNKIPSNIPSLNLNFYQNRLHKAICYHELTISRSLVDDIRSFSLKKKVLYSSVFQLAYYIFLSRYSNERTIAIGNVVNGRGFGKKAYSNVIGLFAKRIVNIQCLEDSESVICLLDKVNADLLASFSNSDFPYEDLVREINKRGKTGIEPLFNAVFNVIKQGNQPASFIGLQQDPGLQFKNEQVGDDQYDIGLSVLDSGSTVTLRLDLVCDEIYRPLLGAMLNNYVKILSECVKDPEKKIGEIEMLDNDELLLLSKFSGSRTSTVPDRSIIELFSNQVILNPKRVAVRHKDGVLTYIELHEKSNQLANYLKKKGVCHGSLVGVCLDRSLELFIALLGIVKAGAAYIPIDPQYPAERIRHILGDAQPAVLICNPDFDKYPGVEFPGRTINICNERFAISQESVLPTDVCIRHDDLIYVIYTSGSTGKPKGVMVEQKGVLNLIQWHIRTFNVDHTAIATAVASFSFDAFGWEFWPYLLSGATVVLIDNELRTDPVALCRYFLNENVTHSFIPSPLVPAFIDAYQDEAGKLQFLLTGGDRLMVNSPGKTSFQLVNNYGPTENSVVTTSYYMKSGDCPVLIGKPIDNNQVYILTDHLRLAPIGVPGELYIGGMSLARGYLNQAELTREKFISNPFSGGNGRLYRTGDICRWLPDGNIEYLNRNDDQVKIRGSRIELGEITSCLISHTAVKEALVTVRPDKQGAKQLIAYIVPETNLVINELSLFLSQFLPDYMIPSAWIQLEKMPLTPNGKIDKAALPEPEVRRSLPDPSSSPKTGLQQIIADIWLDLLQIEALSIHDNFFSVGGDSIISIQVVSRLVRAGYNVRPKDIFQHPDINTLAMLLSTRTVEPEIIAEQGVLYGMCGLLPIQKWYFKKEADNPHISHFNQSLLLKIGKTVSLEQLTAAIDILVARHDSLRFVYSKPHADFLQSYGQAASITTSHDLSALPVDEFSESLFNLSTSIHQHVDIFNNRIFIATLIVSPRAEQYNRLLLVCHHLAVDGVSWRILREDLELILNAQLSNSTVDLGLKTSSYRQWCDSLSRYADMPKLSLHKAHWKEAVAYFRPLQTDKNYRGVLIQSDIETLTLCLTGEETSSLLSACSDAYLTEINDLLLAPLSYALSSWTGLSDIVIGLEGHGREESVVSAINLSRTVGWFTSLFPLVLHCDPGTSLESLIMGTKELIRKMPDKGLSYGVLKYLGDDSDTPDNPWEVIFNYLGQTDNFYGRDRLLETAPERTGINISTEHAVQEKISVNCWIADGKLECHWSYSTRHFDQTTIQLLAGSYLLCLREIIDFCKQQSRLAAVRTPSDYGLEQEITYQELNEFLGRDSQLGYFVSDKAADRYKFLGQPEQIDSICKLSGLQEGMLFHNLYDESLTTYLEQYVCNLKGANPVLLVDSWNHILANHSSLRAAFYNDSFAVPLQCILKNLSIPYEFLDFSSLSKTTQDERVAQLVMADRQKPFDLKNAPLMRLTVIKLGNGDFKMVWTVHHLLVDGWSIAIILQELRTVYYQLSTLGLVVSQPEDRFQDYIGFISRQSKCDQKKYWEHYMAGIEKPVLLPFISPGTNRNKGIGNYQISRITLDRPLAMEIYAFVRNAKITLNTLIQGVWSYLLHKYSGEKEIVFGITVSGRPATYPDIERRVGLYINTVPFHVSIDEESSVEDWLSRIHTRQVEGETHHSCKLMDIQKWSSVTGDLFDSILVFENYPSVILEKPDGLKLDISNAAIYEQTNYPLTVAVAADAEIHLSFQYNSDILTTDYVNQIKDHFVHVLKQMTALRRSKLGALTIVNDIEKDKLLKEFNNRQIALPQNASLVSMFEDQVRQTPGTTAVVYGDGRLTYNELNRKANLLAHHLKSRGVQRNNLVGIFLDKSIEMLIAILGILKSGAAYLPIDPQYPLERCKFILNDTKVDLILTEEKVLQQNPLEFSGAFIMVCDSLSLRPPGHPDTNPEYQVDPNDLAYVLYTSGSTGIPKGVMIEHLNVVTFLMGFQHVAPAENKGAGISLCPFVFDVSVWEFFINLCFGNTLHLLNSELVTEPAALTDYIIGNKITTAYFPPSTLPEMVAHFQSAALPASLQRLLVGVMPIKEGILEDLQKYIPLLNIVNGYGPTETTVCATLYPFKGLRNSEFNVPIGKPIPNYAVYILDDCHEPVPVGVTGELYVSGPGVGRGYWNNKELSQAKFLHVSNINTLVYKTGDSGKWLPDGNIEYIGRSDDQVKIRGYRVELGEIENVISNSGLVEACAVVFRQEKESGLLIGFIVEGRQFSQERFLKYLGKYLPHYMIPTLWSSRAGLPINLAGKIDKRRLADEAVSTMTRLPRTLPRTELEQTLLSIWGKILGRSDISVFDNFFSIGGQSLSAVKMSYEIGKKINVIISLKLIFEFPSIAELAEYIELSQNISGSEPKGEHEYKVFDI